MLSQVFESPLWNINQMTYLLWLGSCFPLLMLGWWWQINNELLPTACLFSPSVPHKASSSDGLVAVEIDIVMKSILGQLHCVSSHSTIPISFSCCSSFLIFSHHSATQSGRAKLHVIINMGLPLKTQALQQVLWPLLCTVKASHILMLLFCLPAPQ